MHQGRSRPATPAFIIAISLAMTTDSSPSRRRGGPSARLERRTPSHVVLLLAAKHTGQQRSNAILDRCRRIVLPAYGGLELTAEPALQLIEIAHRHRLDVDREHIVV